MPRIGTIAYATNQGLGILAKSFWDNGVLTDLLVLRHHCRQSFHEEWYPGSSVIDARALDYGRLFAFVEKLDTLLVFETPYFWPVVAHARDHGVKTALMTMYECTPATLPVKFDLILCPSDLDHEHFPEGVRVNVPVSEPWRKRRKAEVFVHNSGHGGLHGRNGTAELLQAIPLVRSQDVRFLIRSQDPLNIPTNDPRCLVSIGSFPREELFATGDVFVFPEKFNGLSLPLQEAHAAGMLVMATDRFPMNRWLPNEPLIPVDYYVGDRIGGCIPFQSAVVDPEDIAEAIDEWYGRDISWYSDQGLKWAGENSWEALKPRYLELLS